MAIYEGIQICLRTLYVYVMFNTSSKALYICLSTLFHFIKYPQFLLKRIKLCRHIFFNKMLNFIKLFFSSWFYCHLIKLQISPLQCKSNHLITKLIKYFLICTSNVFFGRFLFDFSFTFLIVTFEFHYNHRLGLNVNKDDQWYQKHSCSPFDIFNAKGKL